MGEFQTDFSRLHLCRTSESIIVWTVLLLFSFLLSNKSRKKHPVKNSIDLRYGMNSGSLPSSFEPIAC